MIPYDIYKSPDPGPVRVVYTAQTRELCGIIAHEHGNKRDFHLCKSERQWEIDGGWGNEFGPENGWLVGPAGPIGGLVHRERALEDLPHHSSQGEVHPEDVRRSLAKRAESCPKNLTCAKNEATI